MVSLSHTPSDALGEISMEDGFAKTLFFCIFVVLGLLWCMLCLGCVEPLWLKAVSAPGFVYVAVFWKWQDVKRFNLLGFAHERVREISEEEMKQAMDEVESWRKKNRSV
jgi:hypothetical protein